MGISEHWIDRLSQRGLARVKAREARPHRQRLLVTQIYCVALVALTIVILSGNKAEAVNCSASACSTLGVDWTPVVGTGTGCFNSASNMQAVCPTTVTSTLTSGLTQLGQASALALLSKPLLLSKTVAKLTITTSNSYSATKTVEQQQKIIKDELAVAFAGPFGIPLLGPDYSPAIPISQSGAPAGALGHLGMYTTATANGVSGFGATGGGQVLHENFGVSDTAGQLAAGANVNYRDVSGGGGINGLYDASRWFGLGNSQRLVLGASFDYGRDNGSFGGGGPAFTGVNTTGSLNGNTYAFTGSFGYGYNNSYLIGTGAYNFGQSSLSNNGDSSTGSFNTHGYNVDMAFGAVFPLFSTVSRASSTLPTKAPPKPVGGYVVALDLSGHVGYVREDSDSFADSTGFIIGAGTARWGVFGGRAELLAYIPSGGLLWKPYIAGTVDQQFDFSNSITIPTQAAFVGGDLLSLQEAQTFWGAQLGLDVIGAGGWTVGIKGFYTASADMNITGGNITVKIPFYYAPTVAARY
jgi:hypothetical protein